MVWICMIKVCVILHPLCSNQHNQFHILFLLNTMPWQSTALLVMDMQKDFISLLKAGEAIVPNVIKAVEVARSRSIPIIWIVREHDPFGRDAKLIRRKLYGDGQPKPACKGSEGAELVDGLVIGEGDYKLVKTRFSAFLNTHLHSYLHAAGIDKLVVTGIQTPFCVRQTVFDAVSLDYHKVTVIVDATAAATPDSHAASILDMKNIGVVTPTLEEWCSTSTVDEDVDV